jgi:hypothetical protein
VRADALVITQSENSLGQGDRQSVSVLGREWRESWLTVISREWHYRGEVAVGG